MLNKRRPLKSTGYCTVSKASYVAKYSAGKDSDWTLRDNPFLTMTLGERAYIVRHSLKGFNPSADTPSEKFQKQYGADWWQNEIRYENNGKRVDGDYAYFILNCCLFPARCQDNWEPGEDEPLIDFYASIYSDNAIAWYLCCPAHLRKTIDAEVQKLPSAEEAKSDSAFYLWVKDRWGDRPVIRYSKDEDTKGELLSHYLELELFNQWCWDYDRYVLSQVCEKMAPGMQKERKLLSSALGLGKASDGSLPSQAEGLDDVQAATVRWLQSQGQTPLEFLVETYKDEDAKMNDRIAAARTLMDYVHRKLPSKQEIETKEITAPKLDAKVLRGLSDKELALLEQLLSKLGDNTQ
jgi:hypothetical protein